MLDIAPSLSYKTWKRCSVMKCVKKRMSVLFQVYGQAQDALAILTFSITVPSIHTRATIHSQMGCHPIYIWVTIPFTHGLLPCCCIVQLYIATDWISNTHVCVILEKWNEELLAWQSGDWQSSRKTADLYWLESFFQVYLIGCSHINFIFLCLFEYFTEEIILLKFIRHEMWSSVLYANESYQVHDNIPVLCTLYTRYRVQCGLLTCVFSTLMFHPKKDCPALCA